jgi:hypothetical protein
MESFNDHCAVCGQVIDLGTVSITIEYRRVHPHCNSNRFISQSLPKIRLVDKKSR